MTRSIPSKLAHDAARPHTSSDGEAPRPGAAPAPQKDWLQRVDSSHKVTSAWMRIMFFCARRASWFMRWFERWFMAGSRRWYCGPLRDGPTANAKWLLGPDASPEQRAALVDNVVRNFFRFIHDVGRAAGMSRQQILDRIETVEGKQNYLDVRAARRGLVVATAHLGSFEVGMAALTEHERRVHVVFQRDVFSAFDDIRDQLHQKLGVEAAHVERGLDNWFALREALQRDEVVLIQADRVMPGQKGLPVPFMGGHIELPVGPVKLAALSGAPIVPVFTFRQPDGKVRVVIERAIEVKPDDIAIGSNEPSRPLLELAAVLERHIRAHPDQWLMLHPVWCEDQPAPASAPTSRS